jgi:hypothetical protein
MDKEELYEALLKKDREVMSLDQLRQDHLAKIEQLQKYQDELEKQIVELSKEVIFLKQRLREQGANG